MSAKFIKMARRTLYGFLPALLLPMMLYHTCYGQTAKDVNQQTTIAGDLDNAPREEPPGPASTQSEKKDLQQPSNGSVKRKNAEPSDPSVAHPSVDKKPPETAAPLSQTEQLADQFEQLSEDIHTGKKSKEDADALFQKVSAALKTVRDELRTSMRSWQRPTPDQGTTAKESSVPPSSQRKSADASPQAVDKTKEAAQPAVSRAETLYNNMLALYGLRIKLLELVSPELRSEITGLEQEGVKEFFGEIQQVVVTLRFQTLMSPKIGHRIISNIRQAPVPIIIKLLKLILIILIFRWWRKWAKINIARIYQNLLRAQSSKLIVRFSIKFLWYANHLRSPLEWMILTGLIFKIADPKYIQIVDDMLWTQIRWIFMAWFCIAFINVFAKRNFGSFRSESTNLRARSLMLTVGWLLLPVLALNFTEDLAGKGTIYEWVWMLFGVLTVPVLMILLSWWRPEVRRLLNKEPTMPSWLLPTLEDETGLKSYKAAVFGIIYLLLNWFRQKLLRVITSFEGGRVIVASLTQMEASRAGEIQEAKRDEHPIPMALRKKLLENDGYVIDSIAREELAVLTGRVSQERSGVAMVISGRGGGKSFLLNQVAMGTDSSNAVIINCPFGGFDSFYEAFIRAVDLEKQDASIDVIRGRLEESGIRMVGIDNVHRLSKPVLGGQRDLDRIAELIHSIRLKILWIFTIDRSAWQYISRVRDHKLLLEEVLDLPLWNESQIKELIEHRVAGSSFQVDYSRLALPGQYDDMRFETLKERNQAGYYRILWNTSDGNPVTALRLWIESLSMETDDTLVISIPKPPPKTILDRLNIDGLLVLRAIVQMGMATQMDIIESLKMSEAEVIEQIRYSVNNGWIEERDGYYDISRDWYSDIRRVLSRKNLMQRTTLGDTL